MDKATAVFGGSFDPATTGHAMVVAHLILNEPSITDVLIVPCFQQAGKHLTSFEHRFNMCQEAFGWLPNVSFSRVEEELGGESITARTIKHLAEHTSNKLRFVMGSDLLDKVHTWEGWSVIEELAPPIVVGRAGIPSSRSENTPICPVVSSSMVRDLLYGGQFSAAQRYLPAKVFEYIMTNGLYGV